MASLCVVAILSFVFLMSLLVRLGLFGKIPSVVLIKSIKNPISSVLIDDNGKTIGKYFIENRTNVNYKSISPNIIKALIATEDQRFYQHKGIDLRSWGRVFFKSILLSDESSGGGSTLSQQLAKNLFPRKSTSIFAMPIHKVKEMMMARRLERIYTKEEILTWYLNTVSFGNNMFGIDVACKQLFNQEPDDINIENAAVLVGMLKATGVYSPLRNEDRAADRRNIVLKQMVRNQYLTQHEFDSLSKLPIKLNYNKEGHTDGIATYIREQIRLDISKLLKDYTRADGKPYNLYTDGLKIYTTLDGTMQKYAEAAVHDRMVKLQDDFQKHWKNKDPWEENSFLSDLIPRTDRYIAMKKSGSSEAQIESAFKQKLPISLFTHKGILDTMITPYDSLRYYLRMLNAGLLAVEQKSGKIKAWVGGIDYSHFKYDHVRAKRQVGSTFKPIVMAAGLQQGLTPCDYFANDHIIFTQYENWEPHNSDGKYGGYYSMEGTLVNSVNCAAVDAIIQIGAGNVVSLAKKLGIQSDLQAVPSLALGTADISLLEMVQAFSVFANQGKKQELYYIKRIENNRGDVLIDFEKQLSAPQVILDPLKATLMTQMLKSVALHGTAHSLTGQYTIGSEVAAKTGTTQNQSDGWLMSFTPKLTVGAWVGGEMPQIRFRSLDMGQGSYMALPIVGTFYHKMNADKSLKKFQGGGFPGISDTATTMMGCPYFLDHAPGNNGFTANEDDDENITDDSDTDTLKATNVSRHKIDTVTNINMRKRDRNKKEKTGLGKLIESIFGKKKDKDENPKDENK